MNAPVRISDLAVVGTADDFAECCAVHAWFVREHWITLQTAVDNLQRLAERWDLVDELGQDEVQRVMAETFGQEAGSC